MDRRLFCIAMIVLISSCTHGPIKPMFDPSAAAQARINVGMDYLKYGDVALARQNIERALQYAPNSYRAQLAMALYQQCAGEQRAAQRYYQKALQLAPNRGEVCNNYGVFLCLQRRYSEAQQQFQAALQTPGYMQCADSLYNAGLCFLQAEQMSEASVFLQRALKHQPSKGEHLIRLAVKAFEQGKNYQARWLLTTYDTLLPASASSIELHLRFARQAGKQAAVKRYSAQLQHCFPHAQQNKKVLEHDE